MLYSNVIISWVRDNVQLLFFNIGANLLFRLMG